MLCFVVFTLIPCSVNPEESIIFECLFRKLELLTICMIVNVSELKNESIIVFRTFKIISVFFFLAF
jgi:hypothetical protein